MTWPDPKQIATPLLAAAMAHGKTAQVIKAVPRLDLDRLAGRWHEIARRPWPTQRTSDRHIALHFTPQDNGDVIVEQLSEQPDGSLRKHGNLARRRYPVEEPGRFRRLTGPAWLRMLPWVWDDYWVLALDPQYQWVMIGDPDLRSLWMLAREQTMERSVLEMLKTRARNLGYDLAPLIVSGELRSYQPV